VLIDGAVYAEELRGSLLDELSGLPDGAGIATLLIGEDLAAQVYPRRIDRHARELGVHSRQELLPGDATLLSLGMPRFVPSTPPAAFHILDRYSASVEPIAEAVSPVPGGVGPITDMWLLRNTIDAAWLQAGTALSERHRAERTG
jgi:5,10-methylene-tetrahydrofolate dehydrogenase/methenyl tetrahydrofolate cyclohydrolase